MKRPTFRLLIVAHVLALVAGCGSAGAPGPAPSTVPPSSPSSSPTTTPVPTTELARDGCPVPDDAFCDTATELGQALLDRNAAALLRLSRSETIECAEVAREYFPRCESADVLTGYGLSGANFVVDVVPMREYADRLTEVVSGIDPDYTDELGGGSPTVVGVGTCGPDIPRRRTYHLAWTAAIDDGNGPERHLGSFEVGFDGEDWRVILWYLDPLAAWEDEQPDPMTLSFCEAGLHPWER